RSRPELAKLIGLAVSLAVAVLAGVLLVNFDTHDAGFHFLTNQAWISDFGIRWHLVLDGISLFLVALTAGLFPISLAGPRVQQQPKAYMAWMLLLEAGCLGTFVALDLFVFFLMFEVVLVPMYFLIAGWGYANRVYASLKFFI